MDLDSPPWAPIALTQGDFPEAAPPVPGPQPSLNPSKGASLGQAEPSPDQPTLCPASVEPSKSKPIAGDEVQSPRHLEEGKMRHGQKESHITYSHGQGPRALVLAQGKDRNRPLCLPFLGGRGEAGCELYMCI